MRIVSLGLVASLVLGMQFALAADQSAVDYIKRALRRRARAWRQGELLTPPPGTLDCM